MVKPASDAEIRNATRGSSLHERARWCMTPRKQALGLMWRRPGPADCLVFPFLPSRIARMHMWFVFGSIDIIALDGRGLVVALKERFRPWTLWSSREPVSCVVELPVGTIRRSGTRVGDKIALPRPPVL